MAQRSVRKMLQRQAKLTGRPATAKGTHGKKLGSTSLRPRIGQVTKGTGQKGKPIGGATLRDAQRAVGAQRSAKPRVGPLVGKHGKRAAVGSAGAAALRKVLPAAKRAAAVKAGSVKKRVQKNPQRSVASMKANQARLKKR